MPIAPTIAGLLAQLGLAFLATVVAITAILRVDRSDVVAVLRALPEPAATLMRSRRRR
ncbi:hypothetical protein [Streptomyces sp. NPDC001919]